MDISFIAMYFMFIDNREEGIMVSESRTLERRGLAKGLRLWLDLILVLVCLAGIALVVVWPILVWAGHEVYQITIPVTIHEDAIFPRGMPEGLSLVETMGELKFIPESLSPKFLYWVLSVVVISILVYGILLLRRILRTAGEGFPFHPSNPKRLNELGWLIIVTSLAATFAGYLAGRWALSKPEFADLPLSPYLGFGQGSIFTGLLVLVLAAIWKEAVRMAEDQALTV